MRAAPTSTSAASPPMSVLVREKTKWTAIIVKPFPKTLTPKTPQGQTHLNMQSPVYREQASCIPPYSLTLRNNCHFDNGATSKIDDVLTDDLKLMVGWVGQE